MKRYKNRNEFIVQFYDHTIKFDLSDPYSKHWFLPRYDFGKIHEPLTVKMIADNLNPNSVFFDLGAHLGYFSIVAASICKKVECFEVDSKCLPLITKNISINNFDNISINNLAVSNAKGSIKIPKTYNPKPNLSISESDIGALYSTVQTIDLDSFCKISGQSPDLIKIDVEGAEFNVLEGMQDILKNGQLKILIEVHPGQLEHFGKSYKDVINMLLDHSYKIIHYKNHRSYAMKNFDEVNSDSEINRNTMFVAFRDNL